MSKQNAISAALCPLRDGRFFESLASRVALQTVSGPDASEETLLTYYSDFLERDLEKLGFKCERLANPVAGASPFLYAERIEDAGFLTVLTYGHGDVISGQEDKWEDGLNPWILTEKAGEWFGRGVADNKGQHLVNLVALTGTFYSLLIANGGQLLDAKMRPVFNSPIGVRTLEWFVRLYKAGAVPKGSPNYVWDDLGNNFAAGKIALDLDWPGFASFYNDPKTSKIAGRVGVVRAPLGAGNRRPGWSGSHSFSIARTCDRPEVAASFIEFLTSHDSQMVEARLGTIPSRLDVQRDAQKEFEAKHDDFMANAIAMFSAAAKDDAFTPPRIAQWNEISNAIWPELQRAIIGDKTSKQALDDAAKRVADIMQDTSGN